jgi:mono/diheme cytochrome c family protein
MMTNGRGTKAGRQLATMVVAMAATFVGVGCGDSSITTGTGGRGGSVTGAGGGLGGMGGGLTAMQARGQYLVDHVMACGDCHTPQGPTGPVAGKYLAGNPDFAEAPNGDKLGSRNLTNDATGLKNRSDAEIKNMFLNGMRPAATGTTALNPIMPYYVFHNMTDADADAIVAYLRTVPAVVSEIPARGALFDVPAPAPALPVASIPMPADTFAEKASAVRGRYLAAEAGVCIECHTKHLAPGSATVLDETKLFAGGEDFSALFADTLGIKTVSKNLTSDATGLSTWVATDIVRALKMGVAKDGSGICPPMPVGPNGAFGGLTDADALDIANYIKSLPPIANTIVDMCSFSPPSGSGGGAGGSGGGAGGSGGHAGGSGGAAGGTTGGAGSGGHAGGAGGTGG